jgi:hypothetical protein
MRAGAVSAISVLDGIEHTQLRDEVPPGSGSWLKTSDFAGMLSN